LFQRVPVHLAVRYPSGQHLRESYIDSLSGGGVFIRTSAPLAIGTELAMEIVVEGEAKPVRVRGQVVWERLYQERPERSDRPQGMGVRFLEPVPPALARLLTPR
jgi:uncharacterized protein (TIGR02266 family)